MTFKITAAEKKAILKKRSGASKDTREINRFKEIMEEIKALTDEAFKLTKKVLGSQSRTTKAADVYWRSQIKNTVDGGGSMETMKETLQDMKKGGD